MNITLKSYTIRTKLLLNFTILLGLFILSLTIYQFTLDNVESGYQQLLNEKRNIYDKTLQVRELLLKCRKNENGFRLAKKPELAALVLDDIDKMLEKNSKIILFAKTAGTMPEIYNQAVIITDKGKMYRNYFQQLLTAHEKIGLTPDSGLKGQFRKIAHELFNIHLSEHALGPILNSINRIRHFSHQKGPESRSEIRHEFTHLQKIINNYHARPVYLNQFTNLFVEYQKIISKYLAAPEDTRAAANLAAIDTATTKMAGIFYNVNVPEVKTMLLQIRRHEKDYLLRGDTASIEKTHKAINQLIAALQDNITNKDDSIVSIDLLRRYKEIFDKLTAENNHIKNLTSHLQEITEDIEAAGENIIKSSTIHAQKSASLISQRSEKANRNAVTLCITALILGLALSLLITNSITKPLQAILNGLQKMAAGDYRTRLTTRNNDKSDLAILARMFNLMAESITRNDWFADGENLLAEKLRQDLEIEPLCREIISFTTSYLDLPLGTIYLRQQNDTLMFMESYAHSGILNPPKSIKFGHGVVGEAAREGKAIILNDLPADYLEISSSTGGSSPSAIIALPIVNRKRTVAVLELATFKEFTKEQLDFLKKISEAIAIALNVSRQRTRTNDLLQETQEQSEELQTQQEELKTANEELAEQTKNLQLNEEELKSQQEELQVTNEELEEKAAALTIHNKKVTTANRKLEAARLEIEQKAKDLTVVSQYKSEFLANMSHELRTPLNSLLLLANNLAQNKKNNLEQSQVESAQIIYNSGKDLLQLINDILDLSKIEAGQMDVATDRIGIRGFADWLNSNFQHMAKDKEIQFSVTLDQGLPKYLISDRQRLEQIIRNLVANAIKFTEEGSVTINFSHSETDEQSKQIAIAVCDTGIGITPEQQEIIFAAFKQADGGTSRKYGGTGLGLSISRQLSKLLNGKIKVTSKSGEGATFTLYLPLNYAEKGPQELTTAPVRPKKGHTTDDRQSLDSDSKSILIIEDDLNFAKILQNLGHEKGFKCLIALNGSDGIELAEQHTPDAVILDIRLPDISGWQVLDSLKNSPSLRHIPVHMMSGEEKSIKAVKKGAMGFLTKPISEEELKNAFNLLEDAVSKRLKKLLIVEDDQTVINEITRLIAADDLNIQTINSGAETINYLKKHTADCMILDIGLPDMTGFTLLAALNDNDNITIPPIIIYTSRELTREENDSLKKYTDTIIIKGLKSEERLLDETALFLHRIIKDMPTEKREMIANLYDQDSMFADKKILLVDDDMRNAFALSKVLEERGMKISIANNGQHALDQLAENSFDLVLMDIMMPVMDGYKTMDKIRKQKSLHNLPIIALTAKAMAEDKKKCMAAGASDYLAKPVNEGQLISMMRVWLYR